MWASYYGKQSAVRRLSKDEIIKIAPSVLTVDGQDSLSNRYTPISSMDIIDILERDNWHPAKVQEVKVRQGTIKGYQKHLIRFQNDALCFGDEKLEAVLTNSHDGKSSYKFMLGIYRLVCSNGLVVGNTFDELCLRHVGLEQQHVLDASRKMLDFCPKLLDNVNILKKIELTPRERDIFGESAKMLLFPKMEDVSDIPISNEQILKPRRWIENGKNDLWTTYNIVQENIMKGGIRNVTYENFRRKVKTTRQVKAIDRNIQLNRALWNLTEKMKEIKTICN